MAERLASAGLTPSTVEAALADGGDLLYRASVAGEDGWVSSYGGALGVALLAAEISALVAHLNSRAALVRAQAVHQLLDEFSAVAVAAELGVSRQKVYDIARASERDALYISHVPWRRNGGHDA